MSISARKPPFFFLGNDPAVDLVNTTPVLSSGPVELLASFADLVGWLAEAGLLTEAEAEQLRRRWGTSAAGDAALAQVRRLRAALRRMFDSIAAGRGAPAAELDILNAGLRRGLGYLQLGWAPKQRRLERRWHREASDAASQVLAPIADAAATLLTQKDLSLLRRCENPACVLYFLDTSKNHARRWCSMEVCGNRMKVAAHYRRHHG